MSSNPAALQGWVKSTDPNTGRDFFANHVTRKTQWEPPDNWKEEAPPELPLPDNWEELQDPTTGKKFYVNHANQTTQWTRPVPESKPATSYLQPAVAQSSSAIHRRVAPSPFQPTRTYSQEAAYYSTPNVQSDVDLSDSLPNLEFKVQTVADALRDQCPHCQEAFSYSKRRHHCRLCGDVFCDACSNHRCDLPLPGPEFEKPVRVCDFCFTDVERGNFFSMRRYLTVLHLYNGTDDESGVATASNVNAALSALTQDLDQMVHSADQLSEKLSIPPEVLIPELLKHLSYYDTCDRAVCCLASLLSLENLAGSTNYTLQVAQANITAMLLDLLDRNASDRRTLFVNEQAAKTLFYLTESKITGYDTSEIDMSRAMRTLLDAASSSQRNPNLQRWAVSTLTNVIVEDQRRACNAVNEVAAILASGMEEVPVLNYDSYLNDWVQSGGLMLLGSLVSVDDADTRAHAVTALGAALHSARSVQAAHEALRELTGGEFGQMLNLDMVRPIVAAGGCAGSVAQLLLSAENNVAGMGATFLRSLVQPLLENTDGLESQYDYNNDLTEMGACREAAVEIVSGSCLPALVSLVRTERRPMDLRWLAMECLAVVTTCVGEIGRSWASGQYEEGLERNGAPSKIKEAMMLLNEEGVLDCALEILQSPIGQSLGSSGKETSAHRIREGAGMLLSALTSCSAEAIMGLQNKNILSALLVASNDMIVPSTVRGDCSPRCLGVVETVANLLMFSWQHPSGSEKDLLDTLIEMIDSGAITYISGVIALKADKKSVGAIRGRAAACRFLCCLFGIALTDSTGIGMRRVMDAVDSDSRSYRSVTRKGGGRTPGNIIEATLGVLQTASSMARKILTEGGDHAAVIMELVEAALLAVGSMCGSSIPPGGSEGTLITGKSFLEGRNDPYVARRQEICNFACDIVVRGGRGEPSILPTMVVGGFGEGSVTASIRIALAIAQNGAKEQHAKLAMSGILVPISDLLRSALSTGDIYKFSASLALVRFCGPHIATGQGGGLQSVRDAIRVATNVLTLPVIPNASPKQIETQETLKSECISALESLSQNASLWSSISTDALPSIARYLQSTAGASPANQRAEVTKTAALRSVLQIVQVPSHAVSAAEAGIALPLGSILSTGDPSSGGPMLALEVLNAIAKNQQARQKARFLECGLVKSICNAVGKSATDSPKQPTDSRADVTFLGLEILLLIHSDVEGDLPTEQLLQSPQATAFLDAIGSEPQFIRAVCAAVISTTKMKLRRHDAEASGEDAFDIPRLYGPPLLYVPESCGGYESTHGAAEALLFSSMVYACALETQSSDTFWQTFLLQNLEEQADPSDCLRTSATVAAHVLSLLTDDHQAFVPKDSRRQEAYLTITRPLVRHRLLEALRDTMADLTGEVAYGQGGDPYMTSLLVAYNVPHICLSLWKDPALLDLAFELIKQIVEQDPDEVLHLFVEGKPAIMSLFDLLNLDSSFHASTHVGEIRSFLATVLGQLAENGLLKDAVERYNVRSSAISALAAACLSEEERPPDEDEDMTSNKLSTVLMQCLVDLCTVSGKNSATRNKIRLASAEASSIAKNLGKKICHMVLSRFLERSKLQQYEMDDDENIMDAPDVAMLCAVAQHDEALTTLRSIGGLHALSLIAAEGEISALEALKKACSGDANVLLEGETYVSMMGLIASDDNSKDRTEGWKKLETLAFELLGNLSSGSAKGKAAVASSESCSDCIEQAISVVTTLAGIPVTSDAEPTDQTPDVVGSDVDSEDASNEEDEEDADCAAPEKGVAPIDLKKELGKEDFELGVAACHFLASLTTTTAVNDATSNNEPFVASLSNLAKESPSPPLQFSVVALVTALATCSTPSGALTPTKAGEVFLSILGIEKKKFKATATLNSNRVYESAVNGLSVVFDSLPAATQKTGALVVASHFVKSVKACIVTRSTTREEDRMHAAEFSYSLALALLLFRGKDFVDEVFSGELLGAMVHLLQWHQDPKTNFGTTNKKVWDASVATCTCLLSTIVWRPDEVLASSGIKLDALAGSVLMLARPGKAPRKATDVKSALKALAGSADAATSVAAQRLYSRLF